MGPRRASKKTPRNPCKGEVSPVSQSDLPDRCFPEAELESQALQHDVLLRNTYFFREPESFEALKNLVFPQIFHKKSSETPVRIWVAGCSTGEDAYSIAICLLEFLSDRNHSTPIQIYATDLNQTAIDQARDGLYDPSQLTQVCSERLDRFFVQVEGKYQISQSVRQLCVFAKKNLISDPPFSRLDLIHCRNLLSDLDAAVQKKLLSSFHFSLKADGFLLVGCSESLEPLTDWFTPCDRKHKIYTKKLTAVRPLAELATKPYFQLMPQGQPLVNQPFLSDLELQRETDRLVLNQTVPAAVVVDVNLEILQFRGQMSPYLEPTPGRASLNLLRMVKPALRRDLQSAIHQAKQQHLPVKREGLPIEVDDRIHQISIHIIPCQLGAAQTCFLVLFAD